MLTHRRRSPPVVTPVQQQPRRRILPLALAALAIAITTACSAPQTPQSTPMPQTTPTPPASSSTPPLSEALRAIRKTIESQIGQRNAGTPPPTRQPTPILKEPTHIATQRTPAQPSPPDTPPAPLTAILSTPSTGSTVLPQKETPTETPRPRPTERLPDNPAQDAFDALCKLPWVEDGRTPQEQETYERLTDMIRFNPTLAHRVVQMQFLETYEHTDLGAVSALAYLSWYNTNAADQVANHPWLRGGITNDQTVAVALTYGEYLFGGNPAQVLGTGGPEYQTYLTTLPLAGDISITIAADGGPSRGQATAARIQADLIWLEEYLQRPLPTANVLLHYGSTIRSPVKGSNVQTSIMLQAGHQNAANYHWLRHELMHYWFNSNRSFLDEGISQVLTSLLNGGGRLASLPATSPYCPENTRISDLGPEADEATVNTRCLYAVAERFMRTLYQEAGYDDFQKGIRRLIDMANRPPYRDMGLDQLGRMPGRTTSGKQAFDRSAGRMATTAEPPSRWSHTSRQPIPPCSGSNRTGNYSNPTSTGELTIKKFTRPTNPEPAPRFKDPYANLPYHPEGYDRGRIPKHETHRSPASTSTPSNHRHAHPHGDSLRRKHRRTADP